MTGTALIGRLGIILYPVPTLGRIIPTLGRIIRVYDPSEEDSSTKQGLGTAQWRKGIRAMWSWRQSTNHTHRPQPAISGQCRSSKWETERAAGEKFEFRPQGPLVYCRFTFLYFIYYDYDCQRALNCCLNLQKGKSFFLRAVKQHISLSAIASVAYRDII